LAKAGAPDPFWNRNILFFVLKTEGRFGGHFADFKIITLSLFEASTEKSHPFILIRHDLTKT
jgi:hypothetical protein